MSYLGKKGYTIYKKDLESKEQQFIRNELTVKPYLPKSPAQPEPFPIYRESPNKFYLPRYFGEDNFGENAENKLSKGDDIDIKFNGEMREYQTNIVNKYINFVKESGGGLLDVDPGKGKTVMALYIISQLKKKALVIVHKSFLLNQWIERIEQFLPNARVGKIQGQVIDIENKDIVIGMLQSLSQKEYPESLFDCFGISIYDETHHLGAETFSRSMLKIQTNYTLGLSGTMQRKDGLTKVFKMFLGGIIHKEKTDTSEHKVIVKAINYKVNDDEYDELKTDYRGNPLYSSMITKLCNYNRRSEFIVKVIDDILKENDDQQILVLAHNKSILAYFNDSIKHKMVANGSVGYYVGGMKEAALKLSETKKIILATYAMASEALDIKSLTSLVMATPKTDITQSVGRILRTNHAQPLVIDIIDQHDIFQNQWKKRKTFYIKNGYKIIHTNNTEYELNNWETLYEKGVVEKTTKSKKCLIKLVHKKKAN